MIRTSAYNSHSNSFFWIPSGIAINYVNFSSSVEVVFSEVLEDLEGGSSNWFVYVSPGNLFLSDGVIDN
jgi:hypothetical protein